MQWKWDFFLLYNDVDICLLFTYLQDIKTLLTFSRESFLKHELILHTIQNLLNFRNLGCIYSILPQRTMLRLTTAKAYQMEV